MSGTYEIVKKADGGTKFAYYVKFNEKIDKEFYSKENYPEGGEYWECEVPEGEDPSEFIASALQTTADADAAHWAEVDAKVAEVATVEIVDGKIAL